MLSIESIGRLVDKHLVLFVTIEDSELEDFIVEEPEDIATLEQAGYVVHGAGNGREALAALEQHGERIDGVVLGVATLAAVVLPAARQGSPLPAPAR